MQYHPLKTCTLRKQWAWLLPWPCRENLSQGRQCPGTDSFLPSRKHCWTPLSFCHQSSVQGNLECRLRKQPQRDALFKNLKYTHDQHKLVKTPPKWFSYSYLICGNDFEIKLVSHSPIQWKQKNPGTCRWSNTSHTQNSTLSSLVALFLPLVFLLQPTRQTCLCTFVTDRIPT